MKKITLLLALMTSFLVACNQADNSQETAQSAESSQQVTKKTTDPIHDVGGFIEEDATDLNHEISAHGKALIPEEIVKMYYPHQAASTKETISINKEKMEDGNTKITLIDDNMVSETQKTTKIELILQPVGKAWKVVKIQKQWKCYEGKGHTDWGIQTCK